VTSAPPVARPAPRPRKTLRRRLAALHPYRLTGPIFTKELRLSSRRRRNYVLRFAYVALLAVWTGLAWLGASSAFSGGGPQAVTRISEAGKQMVLSVAWFQLLAVQLVAVAICSTSISEEVYRRTLPALLSTPITPMQVVAGKLLGKVWQLALLVLISLPVMAVLRLFGGVTWQFVLASALVTLTGAMVAGAIAMFYSVLFRQSWLTIVVALLTMAMIFGVLTQVLGIIVALVGGIASGSAMVGLQLAMCVSPYGAMGMLSMELMEPGSTTASGLFVAMHCVAMIALTFVILLPVKAMVRRRALRMAVGANPSVAALEAQAKLAASSRQPAAPPANWAAGKTPPPPPPGSIAPAAVALASAAPPVATSPPTAPRAKKRRPLSPRSSPGRCPVMWRELNAPLLRDPAARILAIVLPLTVLACIYGCVLIVGTFYSPLFHGFMMSMYMVCLLAVMAVLPATTISTEREAGTLVALLTTPIPTWRILLAKSLGVLRRAAVVAIFGGGHLLLAVVLGALGPEALLYNIAIFLGPALFLLGLGTLFSTRLSRTSTAVVATFGTAMALWVIVPMIAAGMDMHFGIAVVSLNPVAQAWLANSMIAADASRWPIRIDLSPPSLMAASLLLYTAAGAGCMLLAGRSLRRAQP
jgi:ABC-type transport system involved in multi-copper enzyme maturation permease subunit